MHDALWRSATRHPFLAAVRDQTIGAQAFDRWLVQDCLFVSDLLTFQARLLARAPRPAQAVLAGGCVGLVEELAWFEEQADKRGLQLAAPKLPATEAYATLLTRLDTVEYRPAVTALWTLEQVYLDAWNHAAAEPSSYSEFTDHWTTPDFRSYVESLAGLADHDQEAGVVAEVLNHEIAFWDIALA